MKEPGNDRPPEVRPKSGFVAKIGSHRERKQRNAKSYQGIRRAFRDAAIADGWRFAAGVHFSAGPLARPAHFTAGQRAVALLYGIVCHGSFAIGIGAMMIGLYTGMATGLGRLHGAPAVAANSLLLFQFPVLHSFLLTDAGRRFLARLAPSPLGQPLSTTTFAAISSLQILSVFTLWSPTGVTWWFPREWALLGWSIAFASSWILLLKAMWDSGLGIQTGFHGWGAVARGFAPAKISFRPVGSFRYVRQPIYIAFALTLWTGPVWTPDHLVIATAWTVYCVAGPLLKEKRYLQFYGDTFREYRAAVPYWLPRPIRRSEGGVPQ